MSQHFLLSSAARTFSLMALCRLSDEDAYNTFRRLRWPDNDGAPVCPDCDCSVAYVYRCRRVFKCKSCHRQFSVTSGTLFASRKLPFQVLLLAIGLFVNAAKGISSLQVSRDLDIHAKTAFVLLHNQSRAGVPPAGIETVCAILGVGEERPSELWWYPTPLHNVVHGLLRT